MICDAAVEGWKIGMFIAMPVGPTMVLLLRIGMLRGLVDFGLSAFGAACGIGVAMAVALTCVVYIQSLLKSYAGVVHGVLALMVLGLAFGTWRSNKKLRVDDLSKETKVPISLWTAPIVSLTCPFTSILILNMFAARDMLQQEISWSMKVALVASCVFGGFCGYWVLMTVVYALSRKMSKKAVLIMVKAAPFIVLYYGLQGMRTAIESFL